jgi:predicted MPP superfamily phosphohydrolase
VLAVTLVLTAIGVAAALATPTVRRVTVTLERLPAQLDGFTIAQLSDLHIGPTLGERWVRRVVEVTNGLHPDVVAITGDLADGSVERLRPAVAPLGDLRAPAGVYFVTGNPEFYSGAVEWLDEARRLGIRPLENERVTVGRCAATLDLAGVHDLEGRGFGARFRPDLDRALDDRDPGRALVLLAHQPRMVTRAAAAGVGLQLSGHTHGGQLWPWNYLVYLQQPFVAGLHRVGPTSVYVNEGTGFWGPAIRLGTRCEITLVTLRAP